MKRTIHTIVRSLGLLWLFAPVGFGQLSELGKTLERGVRDAAREAAREAIGGRAPATPRPAQAAVAQTGPAQGQSQTYSIKTQDGWTLVAHRYPPRGKPRAGAAPIILCHGLTYNAAFWNLDPSCSFVDYLTQNGYDVWAVDLRGCGSSSKWVYRVEDAPDALVGDAMRRLSGGKLATDGFASIDPRFSKWTLDHHVAHDVPAFVQLVRRETRAADVTWVGHSMGGIVALAHLARVGNPGIGRLITVGSQVTMPSGQVQARFLAEMLQMRTEQLAGGLSPEALANHTQTSVQNLFFNTENVAPGVYQALTGPAVDVPAIGLMQQYNVLTSTGELYDVKRQFPYARSLQKITVPILISCGAADSFAPPAVQQYLYDHVGSPDKTLIVFGRQMGFSVDAGHDDALVGLNSQAEVYPVLEAWIRGARPAKK